MNHRFHGINAGESSRAHARGGDARSPRTGAEPRGAGGRGVPGPCETRGAVPRSGGTERPASAAPGGPHSVLSPLRMLLRGFEELY